MTGRSLTILGAAACVVSACDPPPVETLPPNSFAFGVFADGPYHLWERGRFRRVIADVNRTDLAWLLHVGDLLWRPCSDAALATAFDRLAAITHPVVYTPGENEWADCHTNFAGSYEPLDRLAWIRRRAFADPSRSLGGRAMPLGSQAQEPAFAEFPENARWRFGGFVFATIHLVGSENGLELFPARGPAHDAAVDRRMRAALSWLDQAFALADTTGAAGVVLALHANIGIDPDEPRRGYEPFAHRLRQHVGRFPRPILLVHGDSHHQRVDHPLRDSVGRVYEHFTRLEAFGAPDIGWTRVIVDSTAGRFTAFEPRRMRGWW